MEYKPEDFQRFYDEQIQKTEKLLFQKINGELYKSIGLFVVGITLILVSNIDFNLIPVGVTFFLFGIYFLYLSFKFRTMLVSSTKSTRRELREFLKKHQQTRSMGLRMDDFKIEYYENDQLINTTWWASLSQATFHDDFIFLFFKNRHDNFMIPRFAVESTIYDEMKQLIKSKIKVHPEI